MTGSKRVLLLLGSPKTQKSTSESLGGYLVEKLRHMGFEAESIRAHATARSAEGREKLFQACDAADLIVLSFPLYVDCLPAPLIQALERLAAHWASADERRRPRLAAICNAGFPESSQCATALAICRQFARETGLDWAGGLALGGGGALGGRSPGAAGWIGRNVVKSLDMAAAALGAGAAIPQEAIDLMAKPMVPMWLYILIGSWGWRSEARKYATLKRLRDRPYLGILEK